MSQCETSLVREGSQIESEFDLGVREGYEFPNPCYVPLLPVHEGAVAEFKPDDLLIVPLRLLHFCCLHPAVVPVIESKDARGCR